jgi:hypothetical protein
MKRHALKAYNALKRIGAPVLDPDKGWGGYFAISAELYGRNNGFYEGHIDQDPDGLPWADYYGEYMGGYPYVSKHIEEILASNGLFTEWQNAAVLVVYDR